MATLARQLAPLPVDDSYSCRFNVVNRVCKARHTVRLLERKMAAQGCLSDDEALALESHRVLLADVAPEDAVAIRVFPIVKIIRVRAIVMADQEFVMELELAFSWSDPLFCSAMRGADWQRAWADNGGSWQDQMRRTCWHPNIELVNAHECHNKEHWFVVDSDSNTVTFKSRLSATFAERFELWNFPYDVQPLTIAMRSSYEIDRVKFTPTPNLAAMQPAPEAADDGARRTRTPALALDVPAEAAPPAISGKGAPLPAGGKVAMHSNPRDQHTLPRFILGEWYPLPLVRTRCTPSYTRCVYHMLSMACVVRREHFFYNANYILLAALLASLSFSVIFVPVELFADRSAITLTILLTAVAFKQMVAEKVPMTSYVMLIDIYLLVSLGVIALVTVETCVTAFAFWAHNAGWWDREWDGATDEAADTPSSLHLWPGGGASIQTGALTLALRIETRTLGAIGGAWILFNIWFVAKAYGITRAVRDSMAHVRSCCRRMRVRPWSEGDDEDDDEPSHVSFPSEDGFEWWKSAPSWWDPLGHEGLSCCEPTDRWERITKQHLLDPLEEPDEFDTLATLEPSGVARGRTRRRMVQDGGRRTGSLFMFGVGRRRHVNPNPIATVSRHSGR